MDQQTQEWLNWRKEGIGASDVPVIMNVSPYSTPYKLWLEKTDQVVPDGVPNFVQQKGHELEIVARNRFEIETGKTWAPKLVEHEKYSFLRASLDGYNKEINEIWECKYIGKEGFEEIKNNTCPDKYYPQIQHQLFVTGAKLCHLMAITPEYDTVTMIVYPNEPYMIEKMLPEVFRFRECVQFNIRPILTNRDRLEINDNKDLTELVKKYKLFKSVYEQSKTSLDILSKQIFSVLPHVNCECEGLQMIKVSRVGSIQYGKIPAVKAMSKEELEQFRSRSTSSNQIKVIKCQKEKQ